MQGLFVTGTDTGVGKTVVTAGIVAALRAAGTNAVGLKPVVTGTEEPADGVWPADHELLARVSATTGGQVNALAFGPPVSPHLAAELAGTPIDPRALRAAITAMAAPYDTAIVEGVGGLLVPLAPGYDVAALASDLGLAVVVVARAGLGTINHTLLTLEAARTRGLMVAGVVLNPWPDTPDDIERSNRTTIAALAGVEVASFPELTGPDPTALAAAGTSLPLQRWLAAAAASDRTAL